jgi:hypothetical protein
MERFRAHRKTLRSEEGEHMAYIDGLFGVGLLLGGGWPGAAAAFSVLIEDRFKDQDLPWDDHDD